MNETKQLTVIEAQQMCFYAIVKMLEQIKPCCSTAVIKSRCYTPVLVDNLYKRAEMLPARPQKRLVAADLKKLPKQLVLRERMWAVKIGNQLIFDAGNYSLTALLALALNIPMAKAYSDRMMCYYSNGTRKLLEVEPITLVNNFRNPPMKGWKLLDNGTAKGLFPQEFAKMTEGYSEEAIHDWRFLTDPQLQTILLANSERSDRFIPFNCVLNQRPVELDHCDPILEAFNGYGNLQPLFSEFGKLLQKGQYDVVKNNKDLYCFERCYYESGAKLAKKAKKKAARLTNAEKAANEICSLAGFNAHLPTTGAYDEKTLYPKTSELELVVGLADASYSDALALAADKAELKRRKKAGEKLFCLDADGGFLDARMVINSKKFEPSSKRRILLFPDGVYEAWGKDFSPKTLESLNARRTFDYTLISLKFKRNLIGRGDDGVVADTMTQRLLELPSLGFKTIDGIDVEELGKDLLAGKVTLADIGRTFTKIAMMVETQSWGESAHYSSPGRRGNLTGYLYERQTP